MAFSRKDTKVIKGIAIILMLYHHLFYFSSRLAEGVTFIPLFFVKDVSTAYYVGKFGKICVALFLFLGGYGTFISCRNSTSDTNLSEILAGKIKRLYLEYWKVFAVFVPLCMIANVERVTKTLESFLWNLSGLSISYCGEWWFFTPYVGLIATFTLVFKHLKKDTGFLADLTGVIAFDVFVRYVIPHIYEYQWAVGLPDSLFWNVFLSVLENGSPFYMGCIFAKHDLLCKMKHFFLQSNVHTFAALLLLPAVFYMRNRTGMQYDYIFAPLFTAVTISVIEVLPTRILYHFLCKIGTEGTIIWLVHSIYCYLLCQKLVFVPKYSVLICAWLLGMSYITSIVLHKVFSCLPKIIKPKPILQEEQM